MEGKQFGVDKAKSLGLIHDTAENDQELLDKAIAWIKANPKSQQPFDVKGYKIPVVIQNSSSCTSSCNCASHVKRQNQRLLPCP